MPRHATKQGGGDSPTSLLFLLSVHCPCPTTLYLLPHNADVFLAFSSSFVEFVLFGPYGSQHIGGPVFLSILTEYSRFRVCRQAQHIYSRL